MSDLHTTAAYDGANDGSSRDKSPHLTMSATGPHRPEAGSPLERVLRRQAIPSGAGALLGFVPAQVR